MTKFSLLLAGTALAFPAMAFAQSTGTIDFEEEGAEIVVTGSRLSDGVGGVVAPDTSKARQVITDELIERQVPGQSVNDIINLVPGVSFINDDPFGSAGGKLTIRGFDDTRISQTFDGIPLNDTGGYSLYSQQQLDSELIQQVNVNLGSTDVDSPTASATGSTVNYRMRNPSEDFHVSLRGSAGDFDFFRLFGSVDTGEFTPFGTRALFAASRSTNNTIYSNRGRIEKTQVNGRIYQPIGSNGDFVSLSGHWNEGRNNRSGSAPLRLDANRVAGPDSANRFPITRDEREATIPYCQLDTPQANVADTPNACGNSFNERLGASDTGNVRLNSRFTLQDGLVLTVDPSFQYTKAHGGGTATAREGSADIDFRSGNANVFLVPGYVGGSPYFGGVDLNGDGDTLDQVRVHAPSQTRTNRYGLIASLRYDINDQHSARIAYTFDRGRHRQTGQVGFLRNNGSPVDAFPIDNPLQDASGTTLQKRDRLSYATLHQVSGEYRGEFLNERLTVNAGLRVPFFKRDLNQNCFTTRENGFVDCFGGNEAAEAEYIRLNPNTSRPQQRIFKYDAVLPNAGVTYDVTSAFSVFANYSKGLQVPGTDNLYNSFFFDADTDEARPDPETTDNFDLGVRYRTSRLQAQLSGWYTQYENRLAEAYDPELDRTVYRNLGTVKKYGVDGSISYRPIPQLVGYVFGSYLKSEIQDDIEVRTGDPLQTAGKRESAAPVYTLGGRLQAALGVVEFGVQAKRTGPRYINDQNKAIIIGGQEVYGEKAPAYTVVDFDARIPLEQLGLNDRTYLQLNVTNVFDKLYVGRFDGNVLNSSVPFAQIGAPRTFIGTLVVGF